MKTVNVKSLGECPYLVSLESEDAIGHGSYAQVCRAYNKKNPEEKLAAKIFDVNDARKFESAFKELMIVSSLPQHENLITYKKVKITSKNRIYIIMQLCESSLKKQINDQKGYFIESEVWNFLVQFVEGYKILNKKSIIHRDIKPDNILIGYDGNYKLTDFGLAEIISQIKASKKVKGSLCYLAPELLQSPNGNINSMNDVYSLGVTVYQMCFKKLPYVKNIENLHTIAKFITEIKYNPLVFPHSHPYSQDLINLISSMLEKQQSKRCTWEYIFYIIMQKSIKKEKIISQPIIREEGRRKFKIVEISDALLKNLSYLDTALYKSLANESLVVIDHIEAEIIAKRQIVFYCDRLQYRLQIICEKLKTKEIKNFSLNLLKYTYLQSQHLEKYFQKYYEKIERSEFMKIIASQKYSYIRNLVKQDYLSLKEQLEEMIDSFLKEQTQEQKENMKMEPNKNPPIKNITKRIKHLPNLQILEAQLYRECFDAIIHLYSSGFYEECKQIDQLELWLENKEKSGGILSKLRKNENSLKQFDQNISGLSKQKLKQCITQTYVHILNQIDKKAND